jgi:hypothetical protein
LVLVPAQKGGETTYPCGVGAPEQSGVFFVDLDKLDEIFNSEVGKRHYTVFSDAVDPDEAVVGIHFICDVPQPVFVFAEVLTDTSDCGDVMDLVDVHGYAASTEIAELSGVQFHVWTLPDGQGLFLTVCWLGAVMYSAL